MPIQYIARDYGQHGNNEYNIFTCLPLTRRSRPRLHGRNPVRHRPRQRQRTQQRFQSAEVDRAAPRPQRFRWRAGADAQAQAVCHQQEVFQRGRKPLCVERYVHISEYLPPVLSNVSVMVHA
jgi:hypothetical protein